MMDITLRKREREKDLKVVIYNIIYIKHNTNGVDVGDDDYNDYGDNGKTRTLVVLVCWWSFM